MDSGAAGVISPTAECNGAILRMARWTDSSDLAMVRDAFYPSKKQSQPPSEAFDPYAPVIDEIDQNAEVFSRHEPTSRGNSTARRWAIERVALYSWHDHRVPHALVATAALVDAQLHYEEGYDGSFRQREQSDAEHQVFRISKGAIKSIFAMAFCRFVNGFVDRDVARSAKAMRQSGLGSTGTILAQGQAADRTDVKRNYSSDEEEDDLVSNTRALPKGVGESSMYKHAQTIGMPSAFIDLRHALTHGRDLPSIQELRKGTEDALAWLWDKWWKVNAKGDATVRQWETQRWNEALAAHRLGTTTTTTTLQAKNVKADGGAGNGRWESITTNGVTRFVYVPEHDT